MNTTMPSTGPPRRRRRLPPPDHPDRYLFADLPRCKPCGSCRLRAYHTAKHRDDDGKDQHAECLDCGAVFIIVWT
jgi:hypothetical protein